MGVFLFETYQIGSSVESDKRCLGIGSNETIEKSLLCGSAARADN